MIKAVFKFAFYYQCVRAYLGKFMKVVIWVLGWVKMWSVLEKCTSWLNQLFLLFSCGHVKISLLANFMGKSCILFIVFKMSKFWTTLMSFLQCVISLYLNRIGSHQHIHIFGPGIDKVIKSFISTVIYCT